MRNIFTKISALFAVATASVMAAPVTVDLADANTSLTNVGTAMITLAITVLGFALVLGFISRRK